MLRLELTQFMKIANFAIFMMLIIKPRSEIFAARFYYLD